MNKPWRGEFPLDTAEDMDEQAIEILMANMRAGRTIRCADCGKEGYTGHQDCQYPQDH